VALATVIVVGPAALTVVEDDVGATDELSTYV
jgi:hypothetical protein